MKKLNNIGARTLREKAYQSIKESVLTNTFMPGESLSTDLLAESLGISHTPIREAVVRLADEGILDYEPNKKLRVSEITEKDVKQVYEVRRLLEVTSGDGGADPLGDRGMSIFQPDIRYMDDADIPVSCPTCGNSSNRDGLSKTEKQYLIDG